MNTFHLIVKSEILFTVNVGIGVEEHIKYSNSLALFELVLTYRYESRILKEFTCIIEHLSIYTENVAGNNAVSSTLMIIPDLTVRVLNIASIVERLINAPRILKSVCGTRSRFKSHYKLCKSVRRISPHQCGLSIRAVGSILVKSVSYKILNIVTDEVCVCLIIFVIIGKCECTYYHTR